MSFFSLFPFLSRNSTYLTEYFFFFFKIYCHRDWLRRACSNYYLSFLNEANSLDVSSLSAVRPQRPSSTRLANPIILHANFFSLEECTFIYAQHHIFTVYNPNSEESLIQRHIDNCYILTRLSQSFFPFSNCESERVLDAACRSDDPC